MSQYRIWLAGFFERWPEADNGSGPGAWRAFRYIDGGIWFAADDEDYTICAKEKCYSCDGKGKPAIVWCDGTGECAGEARNGYVCKECGFNGPCRICDGRGYTFVPSRINQG